LIQKNGKVKFIAEKAQAYHILAKFLELSFRHDLIPTPKLDLNTKPQFWWDSNIIRANKNTGHLEINTF